MVGGRGEVVGGWRSQGGGAREVVHVGRVVFEPVMLGAPPHPDVTYAGVIREPVRRQVARLEPERVERGRVDAPRAGKSKADKAVPPVRIPEPEVRATQECPGEWYETWLWEVCQEHQGGAV